MRDKRFVAEHRGGPLRKEQHYQLIRWACDCSGHIVHLFGEKIDERLLHALHVAEEWKQGNASVGDARKASVGAIAAARDSSNPVSIAAACKKKHEIQRSVKSKCV